MPLLVRTSTENVGGGKTLWVSQLEQHCSVAALHNMQPLYLLVKSVHRFMLQYWTVPKGEDKTGYYQFTDVPRSGKRNCDLPIRILFVWFLRLFAVWPDRWKERQRDRTIKGPSSRLHLRTRQLFDLSLALLSACTACRHCCFLFLLFTPLSPCLSVCLSFWALCRQIAFFSLSFSPALCESHEASSSFT